jgi:ABC-type branched-subunit amino acid transport system substrate-binding protein
LKNEGVDAVFLDMVGNDPLNFLTQAKQLGFTPTIMTYNGAIDAFANEKDKSPLNNVIFLNWEITTPQFASLYQKAYGIAPTKSADKYFDAVYVLAQSIANSTDPSQASAYIAKTTFKTPNSSGISFTPQHAVEDTLTEVQIMKNDSLVEWQK